MELTAQNVEEVFKDCLFRDGEEDRHKEAVITYGIMVNAGFHPDRLEGHREDVRDMLHELPDEFQLEKGGGSTFLSACVRKDGTQWGEHQSMEQLFLLGNALDEARWMRMLPAKVLPGGMPFVVVGPFKQPKPLAQPIFGLEPNESTTLPS